MSELKPCPDLRCGADDSEAVFVDGVNVIGWHIQCGTCSFASTTFKNLDGAISDWNSRPNENKLKADAVREAAKEINWTALTKPQQAKDALAYLASKLERGEL